MIPQDQLSQDWKSWRNSHIGASDIPIIIGKSKWMTPHQLWEKKSGFTSDDKDNWAMKRGRDLEPVARELAEQELGCQFPSEVLVHSDLEWASASLDGINRERREILEIKCPGLQDHQCCQKGDVPEHYYPQVQWQLFVADMTTCYYASYYNEELEVVKVERDDDYIANSLLPAAAEFYRCIQEMEEPEKTEDDYIQITDPEFEEYAREWKAASETAKMFSEKEAYYKSKMVGFTDDSNCKGFGVKLTRVQRKGSVQWKSLYEDILKDFPEVEKKYDLKDYTKDQIGYWKISRDK